MKIIKTAKIKLNMLASEALPTIQAYTKAFNFVCKEGCKDQDKDKDQDKNGISLHKKTYKVVREYLPNQLSIYSRMKATETLASIFNKTKHKKYGSQPKSKSCSVRYDKSSYSLFLKNKQVSLLTVSGRKRHDLIMPKCYKGYFQLERFITYKAMAKGIDVKYVDARYTSQRCCKYGFICRSDRKSQSDFLCIQCEFRLNEDLNASRNICSKHLASYKDADRADINQPIVVAEKLITRHQSCSGGN